MKKWIAVLVILMLAVPAMAQFAGLPIASGAAAPEVMKVAVSGGAVFQDDFNLYGVRGSFSPVQGLTLFGDVGVLDPDGEGMGTGGCIQGGGQFTLPLELPVDMALRASLAYSKNDFEGGGELTMKNFNAGVLVSKTIEQITPYGFVGFNYVDTQAEIRGWEGESEDETDFAIAGGLLFAVTGQFSLYAEVANIDDTFFGVGGRYQF